MCEQERNDLVKLHRKLRAITDMLDAAMAEFNHPCDCCNLCASLELAGDEIDTAASIALSRANRGTEAA